MLGYDPTRGLAVLSRRRAAFRARLVGLGITVALMIGFYVWQREQFSGWGWMVAYAVTMAVSVGLAIGFWISYRIARRDLAELGPGPALRIGRAGVSIGPVYAGWPEVASLVVVGGGLGRSPRLQLNRHAGPPVSVPLDLLDVSPATLDSTARAYSGGRHGVDLSALDT